VLTRRRDLATILPMISRSQRFRALHALTTTFVACTPLVVVFTLPAFDARVEAQATPKPAAKALSFTATINADGTLVRCAPNAESGYPFGSLSKGQTVTVLETQPGWVRVRTDGEVFNGWGGYVPALPGVALSADGKTIKITGTAPINAPNGSADFDPDRSWKAVGYLTTGDELPVIDTVKGARDTFYAVPLGPKTSGWIADSAITRNDANTPAAAPANGANTGAAPAAESTTTAGNATNDAATTDATTTTTTTTTDATTSEPAKKPAPKAEPPKTPTPAMVARAKFNEVEKRWQSIQKNDCSMQDLEEIREGFLAVNRDDTALPMTRRNALSRSTQVAQLMELRTLRSKANQVAQREKLEKQEAADLEKWLLARQQYTAVGMLNASVVYDGDRLPRLYRLQDPVSGHTTAYLMEDPELKLSSMLGLVVGVKGSENFDESLRRNVITARSVAVLQTAGDTEIAAPAKVAPSSSVDEGDK
jgi:hypothetical protein